VARTGLTTATDPSLRMPSILASTIPLPMSRLRAGTADAPGVHDTLITIGEDSATLFAAHNVPGTYRIMLRRPGYHDWAADGVKVEWGPCGGGNVAVGARLQPNDIVPMKLSK